MEDEKRLGRRGEDQKVEARGSEPQMPTAKAHWRKRTIRSYLRKREGGGGEEERRQRERDDPVKIVPLLLQMILGLINEIL